MSIIIGIDHGYYAIKTAHCSFPAGLTSYGEHEPYTRQGLLEFGGCFFVCGSGRQPIQRDKTVNDNYYLLTLAAIAKEIQQRGLPPECSVRIAAGLPLTSFGRDKPKFREYLLRSNQPVNYKFEGVEYSITIEEVAVFPQGYAALMTEVGLLQDEPSMLLMDLGGWTVDLKLMNYIRFWQAAGESEKTSIRTRDRIRQIVSSGHYTGGFVCYGYQLVDQGRRNKRDKPVMDLVVNEEEATWVRELFYKVVHEGASGYALAEMLNSRGLRTRAGAKFQSSNILRIIRHEGYTGYIITKNARSEYIPELQIIDQETFEKANDIISRRSAKTAQDRRIAHTSQNTTLLAGIVYCAHCGAKMLGFMHTDRYKLADGSIREKVQPKYNCFQRGQRNKGGRDCDGQALYLAERVDAIVLKIVEEVFEKIRDTPYSKVAENRIRQESNLQKTKRTAVEKKIKAAQHALERFEGEILKCLDGTSNFTEDMIAKQIRRYQQELDDAKGEYAELQNARLNEAAEIRKLRTYYNDFRGWAEEFDTAPLEMKRMILSQLINKVEVGRKYQVNVKFNMKYQQFVKHDAEAESGHI